MLWAIEGRQEESGQEKGNIGRLSAFERQLIVNKNNLFQWRKENEKKEVNAAENHAAAEAVR